MERLTERMPGTTLAYPICDGAFTKLLSPIFTITNVLFLSQLSQLTGAESSAIQNWVKREFVSRPAGKKYTPRQTARIVLINALRTCMQIDKIVLLLRYVNGSLTDERDDIIDDSELYDYFCTVIYSAGKSLRCDDGFLRETITETVRRYSPPVSDGKTRLEKALLIMSKSYIAGYLKKDAEIMLESI